TSGAYVLRLTAGDGALSASDSLTVTVNAPTQPPLQVDSVVWLDGPSSPAVRIGFTAIAGLTYTVQYRDSLSTGGWLKWMDVPSQSLTQTVEVNDPAATNSTARYYRIVTPQQQ